MDKKNSEKRASKTQAWKTQALATVALIFLQFAVTAAMAGGPKFEIEIWCPTDVDIFANGVVDSFDLLVVSESQGSCDKSTCLDPDNPVPCIGDVNSNCSVGALDLAYVMSYLGPCPCEGDLDGDGDRDKEDSAILTAAIDEEFSSDYCLVDIDDNGWVDRFDELAVSISLLGDEDAEPERADVDGSGSTDATDLILVRAALGRDCRADLDRNGRINEADLVKLETFAWACP